MDSLSTPKTLSRPKSTIFASAENRMKRLTQFLSSDDKPASLDGAPPTPPLQPEAEDFLATATPRHATPQLQLQVPKRGASLANGQMDGSVYGIASRGHVSTSNLLTPGSATPTGSRHTSAQFANFAFDPQDPVLRAPIAPFAAGSRPGSRGSNNGSRPGTPGSIIGRSYASSINSVTPVSSEIPRLRKKRGKKKDENAPLAWRMAAGSTANLEQYDIGPLVRGEKSTDLWFPEGDTLVYLQPTKDSDKSKYTKPVFRIHSTPLLFAALNNYVEDSTLLDQPKERASEDGAFSPDDLFLEVPGPMSEPILAPESASGQTDGVNATAPVSPTSLSGTGSSEGPNSLKSPTRSSSAAQSPAASQYGVMDGSDEERPAIYKIYFPVDTDTASEAPVVTKQKKLTKVKHTKADAEDTLQQYIDARNLFAFISRSFLVGSQLRDTGFQVLSKIYLQLSLNDADLNQYDMAAQSKIFLAETHLQVFIDELALDDIRNDDDLIVETLILGERWRSQRLYHEGFLHACGRWMDLKNHAGMSLISTATKSKLDRAYINLLNIRLSNIYTMISNFEFPSVWVGCGRYAEFKGWKSAYEKMRTMVIGHMKHVFGSWPPRAGRRGKGGGYTVTGGLNRVVLKRLYDDLAAVYDLTADREWLHGDKIHGNDGVEMSEALKSKQTIMRKIMHEFDNANVPCQPEMPFNLPKLPLRAGALTKPKKRSFFSREKKISEAEIDAMLKESYNQDALEAHADHELVKEFMATERAFAVGKSCDELMDFRRGRWLFMYCTLQVLPMVVVDGHGLAHGDGVEYFLCENVKGGMPWDKAFNKRNTRMSGMWTANPDGSLMGMMGASSTNLMAQVNPDDEIELIYRRSHCWEVAEEWRLVEAGSDDDSYLDSEEYTAGEYNPGQTLPDSPTGMSESYSGGYTSEPGKLHLDGPNPDHHPSNFASEHNTTPAWAQRAREKYSSPPPQSASRSASPGSSSSPSPRQSSLPSSPQHKQRELQPLEIQPFEFDVPSTPSEAPGTAFRQFHTAAAASPTTSNGRSSPAYSSRPYHSPRMSPTVQVKRNSSVPTQSPLTLSPAQTPRESPTIRPVPAAAPPGMAL